MLGYLASDDRPLVAPAWFIVEDGQLVFNTGRNTAKGRALHRDPRVVVCVDDPHPPFSFVQNKVWRTSVRTQRNCSTSRRGRARYMGSDRAEEYGRRNGVPGELVVRVTPTKVVSASNLAE